MWVEGVPTRLEIWYVFPYYVGSTPCRVPGLKLCEKGVCKAKERNSRCAMEHKAGFFWKFNVLWFESGMVPRGYWIWTVSWAGVAVWGGCRTFDLQLMAIFVEALKGWAGGTVALGLTLSALLPGFLQVSGTVYASYCMAHHALFSVMETNPPKQWAKQTFSYNRHVKKEAAFMYRSMTVTNM